MNAKFVSIVSVVAASSCCIVPLVLMGLTVMGVGTLGFAGVSSTLGSLKWFLLPLALFGVGTSYWLYFREKRKCSAGTCKMAGEKFTKLMLAFSTVVVCGFLFWSVSPYVFGTVPVAATAGSSSAQFAVYTVEGMTCGGCEIAVDEAIKATGLVDSVTASFMENKAYVWFKDDLNSELIVEAIASVGYKANLEAE